MTTLEDEDRIHELRVLHRGGHNYTVKIDGHEVRPTSLRIQFDQAAEYAVAKLTLPVLVENLEALAVLDISLDNDSADHLEEC